MFHAERVALQGIFELDCAEEMYLAVMDSKIPEGVAAGMRLLLTHMHSWTHQMLAAMTVDRMDVKLPWRSVLPINNHRARWAFRLTQRRSMCTGLRG